MILLKEKRDIIEYSRKLITSGLTRGTGGNISIFNRKENVMLITPSGIPYETMGLDDVVVMNMDGEVVESSLEPSSEWHMHLETYKARPEFNALVHVHSTFATTLACLREDLPSVDYLVAMAGSKTVKCAEYALYGTEELAMNAIKAMEGSSACLLANHGMNVAGESLMMAFAVAEQLEFCAELYVRAKEIGEPVLLTDQEMDDMLEKVKTYGQKRK